MRLKSSVARLALCGVAAGTMACSHVGSLGGGDAGTDTDTDVDTDTDTDTDLPTDCTGLDDFTLCYIDTTATEGNDRSYDICISGTCQSPGCGTEVCNAPGPHFPLADTNQRTCSNATAAMICPASGSAFYGQDAQYGWDVKGAHKSAHKSLIFCDPGAMFISVLPDSMLSAQKPPPGGFCFVWTPREDHHLHRRL